MNQANKDKLREAIIAATERLHVVMPEGPPVPGYLYLYDTGKADIAVEWLLARHHPDDQNLVLLVPVDDFPLVGIADMALPGSRPQVARCGLSIWVPIMTKQAVGQVTDEALRLVRQKLAQFARGQVEGDDTPDEDPEYISWMRDLYHAGKSLGQA